jgi:hypothetical protein
MCGKYHKDKFERMAVDGVFRGPKPIHLFDIASDALKRTSAKYVCVVLS